MANKRQLKKQEKKEAEKALQSVVESGTVAELMFSKVVDGYKQGNYEEKTEKDNPTSISKTYESTIESMSGIINSIKAVTSVFKSVSGLLSEKLVSKLEERQALEYQTEEAKAEAVPVRKEKPTATGAQAGEKSIGDLIKDFFTNPAIIAAFSGLVYLFLPKEIKEKIGSFFTGFKEGLGDTAKELDTFKTALLVAAGGLATYLGAGVLKSIAEALTTTFSLISRAKTAFGKLGKTGKIVAGAAVAGGAVAAGAAIAGGKEEDTKKEEAKKEETPSSAAPGAAPAAATEKPAPAGTAPQQKTAEGKLPESRPESKDKGMGEAGAAGIKPGAKAEGVKMPSGSDADVKKMIIHHEGIRYKPYKDSLGLWTVGVGHLIGDGKSLPPEYDRTFSHAEVMEMFDKDFEHHKTAAEKIPGYDKMNDKGEAALIDLTFNMGPAWYKKWPNFTRNLKEGNAEGAAKSLEDSKWYTQVGRRAPTIVSLIRNGTEENGSGASSSGAAQISAPGGQGVQVASLEPSQPSTGTKVAAASERNDDQMASGQGSTINNSISNGKQLSSKKGPDAPPPIPSPSADRGSLIAGTRHSTSYA